jgi:hypothetical protein
MCLGNICTPAGVVNGMLGTAVHAVPDPTGKSRFLFCYIRFALSYII